TSHCDRFNRVMGWPREEHPTRARLAPASQVFAPRLELLGFPNNSRLRFWGLRSIACGCVREFLERIVSPVAARLVPAPRLAAPSTRTAGGAVDARPPVGYSGGAMDETKLREKLARIEALFAGATTEGERVAAG